MIRKIASLITGILFGATLAWAVTPKPPYHGDSPPSGGKITEYVSGNICVAASNATAGTCAVNVNGTGVVTATTFTGTILGSNVSGAVATATALAANGTNCSAGNYPLGVDASGNSESCTSVAIAAHISFSSAAIHAVQTAAATPTYQCIAGSTVTWTSNGQRTEVYFVGDMAQNGTELEHMLFLLNSLVPAPLSVAGNKWAMTANSPAANNNFNMSFTVSVIPNVGVNSVCLIAECAAATGANCVVAPLTAGEFGIREYP